MRSLIKIFGVLVGIATILPAFGYALEKWEETIPIIDFASEVDQKAPFTTPLVIKNQSQIFAALGPEIRCLTILQYGPPQGPGLIAYAWDPPPAHGPRPNPVWASLGVSEISPGKAANYACNRAGKIYVVDHDGDPMVMAASMRAYFRFHTAMWPWERTTTEDFTSFRTREGYRWAKGLRAGVPPPDFDAPIPANP